MDFLLIKENEKYIELPIENDVYFKGQSIDKNILEPYAWLSLENGLECFWKNEENRTFLRKNKITISNQDADVILFDSKMKATINDGVISFCCSEMPDRNFIFINGIRKIIDDIFFSVKYEDGDIFLFQNVELILWKDKLVINGQKDSYHTSLTEVDGHYFLNNESVRYRRSPRLVMNVPKDHVVIQVPPEKSHFSKQSIIQMVLPPLIMLILTVVVSFLSSGGAYMVVTAAMTGMTMVFSVVQYFNERKDCKEKNKKRVKVYEEYLLGKRKELFKLHNKEVSAYRYNFPDLCQIEQMVKDYNSRLYEKNYNDDDFLQIKVGKCNDSASYHIDFELPEINMEEDILIQDAKMIVNDFSAIQDKPVVIDLKKAHLGIVGEKSVIHEQLKIYVTQLAFFHSYHDLQIINIFDSKYNDDFLWMNWFPHLKVHSINVYGCINSEKMRDQILGSLQQILKERQIKNEEKKKEARYTPHFLFIIDEPKLVIEHAIMEFLGKQDLNLGFSIIYTTYLRSNLPENIGTVIMLEDSKYAILLLEEKKVVDKKMTLQQCGGVNLSWMARNISALKHEKGMTSHIPTSITFFDMYGIKKTEELHAEKRWKENQAYKTLAVPLGVRAEDDYVYLNLHEKAHGPHGLVAGTTGSGKSEIIQSYILSLIVNYHPYEVGFLLIDYKGGGMVLCQDLVQNKMRSSAS